MANVNIYNLRESSLSEEKRFNKKLGKTSNDIRMKEFLKNEDGKKYKCGGMLNYIFEN